MINIRKIETVMWGLVLAIMFIGFVFVSSSQSVEGAGGEWSVNERLERERVQREERHLKLLERQVIAIEKIGKNVEVLTKEMSKR